MQNRTVGAILITLSLLLGVVLLKLVNDLDQQARQEECTPSEQCEQIATQSNYSHAAIGFLAALFSLGIYLVAFTRSDQALVERLEKEKEEALRDERLQIMQQALDDSASEVLDTIAQNPGVTQNSLPSMTGLSKAKVSHVVRSLEEKNIVRRESDGKTYDIYLIEDG